MRWRRALAVFGFVLAAAGGAGSAAQAETLRLESLSGRPDMISGGDVLVRVVGASKAQVRLDGTDVTAAFRPSYLGGLVGRVEGLKPGRNRLQARAGGGGATLEIVNHPISGPIISGPHQTPFVCQTEANGLGPASGADCSAPSVVTYYYKSAVAGAAAAAPAIGFRSPPGTLPQGFKPLDLSRPRPSDVAKTTTTEGRLVDFIVRREIGTINRAVYEIQVLHQPGEPQPDPWTRTPGWNGRLIYALGGGCAPGYRQGLLVNASGTPTDALLALGYAVATSTLNIGFNNCNDLVSAETLMMVKEYFAERFGPPVHTMGSGASNASMQQHFIAQNYPGLLDGVMPGMSYADWLTTTEDAMDAALLDHAWKGATQPWTEAQKLAVAGFTSWPTYVMLGNSGAGSNKCDGSFPKALLYDAATNPKGTRCGAFDNQVNIWGRDPRTGFARRPVDNIGVQFGLGAFDAGAISAEQFVELNERIGGLDADGRIVAGRMQADPEALRIAYRYGMMNTGGGDLAAIPIIDLRPYLDPRNDVHDRVRSFATRARLQAAHGRAGNHVILVYDPATPGAAAARAVEAFRQMDLWLDAIDQDRSTADRGAKAARARPADLVDACWTAAGDKIAEPATAYGAGRCNQLYPSYSNPRLVAGAPPTDDILKCALKPVRAGDYARPLSDAQLQRLKAAFPQGVCDYSRPGVGSGVPVQTWRRY